MFSKEDLADLSLTVLDKSNEGIAYFTPARDEKGNIVDFVFRYINDAENKILGGNREDYIGKGLFTLFPPGRPNLFDTMLTVFEKGESLKKSFRYEDDNYSGWYQHFVVKHNEGVIVFLILLLKQKS